MHKFVIFRCGAEPTKVMIPILEFESAFDACIECIKMETETGLKYSIHVLDRESRPAQSSHA